MGANPVRARPGRRGASGLQMLALVDAGKIQLRVAVPVRRTHRVRGLLRHQPARPVINLQETEEREIRFGHAPALLVGDGTVLRINGEIERQHPAHPHPVVRAHLLRHGPAVEQNVEHPARRLAHRHLGVGHMHPVGFGLQPGHAQADLARTSGLVDLLPVLRRILHFRLVMPVGVARLTQHRHDHRKLGGRSVRRPRLHQANQTQLRSQGQQPGFHGPMPSRRRG